VDSPAVESFFGEKLASFGTVVGSYHSLVSARSEEKETASNLCCQPFEFFK
jgi:hypothetical protein